MRTYEVTVDGFPPVIYSAASSGKARTRAWHDFNNAFDCTFKNFLRISRVRICPPPKDDGYDYVRRNYGVDPRIGKRVRLINEGPMTGKEGEIVYPGRSTAHVHVILDGRDFASSVHPLSIEFIQEAPQAA